MIKKIFFVFMMSVLLGPFDSPHSDCVFSDRNEFLLQQASLAFYFLLFCFLCLSFGCWSAHNLVFSGDQFPFDIVCRVYVWLLSLFWLFGFLFACCVDESSLRAYVGEHRNVAVVCCFLSNLSTLGRG